MHGEPRVNDTTTIPCPEVSLTALVSEFARVEDLLRSEEARIFGGAKPPRNSEVVRLETYERRLMAMMREAAAPDGR
jgi:hypothetical protein